MDMRVEDSEKREKFVHLAERRTEEALNAIRKIGNLSNRRSYDWRPDDVKKIAKALQEAIAAMEQKFDPKSGVRHREFRL